MSAVLPIAIARCDPTCRCPQSGRCARFLDELDSDRLRFVDGSRTRDPVHGCALFIDVRGAALLEETT